MRQCTGLLLPLGLLFYVHTPRRTDTHMSSHLIKPHNILTFRLKPRGREGRSRSREPCAKPQWYRWRSHAIRVQFVHSSCLSPPHLPAALVHAMCHFTQDESTIHALAKQWDNIVSASSCSIELQTINYEQTQGFDVVLNSWIWYRGELVIFLFFV